MQQCRGNFQISPPDFSCKKTIVVANNGYWPGTAPAPPPAPAWTQMSSHETQDEESVLHTPDILRPLLLSVGDMLAGVGELSGGGSSLGPGYNESQWSAPAPGMQQPISQCVIIASLMPLFALQPLQCGDSGDQNLTNCSILPPLISVITYTRPPVISQHNYFVHWVTLQLALRSSKKLQLDLLGSS